MHVTHGSAASAHDRPASVVRTRDAHCGIERCTPARSDWIQAFGGWENVRAGMPENHVGDTPIAPGPCASVTPVHAVLLAVQLPRVYDPVARSSCHGEPLAWQPPMNPPPPLLCRRCGACCHQREGTILVTDEDIGRWRRAGRTDLVRMLTDGHFGQKALPMKGDGTCVHFGTPWSPNDCSIYDVRPTVCREFRPGCAQCIEAIREHGGRRGEGPGWVGDDVAVVDAGWVPWRRAVGPMDGCRRPRRGRDHGPCDRRRDMSRRPRRKEGPRSGPRRSAPHAPRKRYS